jgi:hypothetical protein
MRREWQRARYSSRRCEDTIDFEKCHSHKRFYRCTDTIARVPSRATCGLARRGARRTHGTALAQKILAVLADLRAMLATCPNNLIGTRDRAILLLGFAGARDRRRSTGDREREGAKKWIPFGRRTLTCPVMVAKGSMDMSQKSERPLVAPS